MKYVRTKDGIYEIAEEIVNEYTNKFIYKTAKGYFYNEDKIKKAETIEELIDKYVLDKIDIIFINKEHTKYRFEGSDEWFDITDTELRKGIYGAIWTEWGLKYVAKYNNNDGEWELL